MGKLEDLYYMLYRNRMMRRLDSLTGPSCAIVLFYLSVFIVAVVFMVSLSGCATQTKVVEVEKVRNDTAYIVKLQKDSVWLHDSIHVREKGDTLLIEKWHTQWRERIKTDTLYKSKVDSIPVPYPVEKLVENKLHWWQKTLMWAGATETLAIILLVMGCCVIGKRS